MAITTVTADQLDSIRNLFEKMKKLLSVYHQTEIEVQGLKISVDANMKSTLANDFLNLENELKTIVSSF